MTTPSVLPGGYPDFGKVEQASSALYLDVGPASAIPSGTVWTGLYVGAWAFVRLCVQAGTASLFQLDWYGDSSMAGNAVATDFLETSTNKTGILLVATRLPYLKITMTTGSGGVNNGRVTLLGEAERSNPGELISVPHLIDYATQSLGAGATATTDANAIIGGLAQLRYSFQGAAFTFSLVEVDYLGAETLIWLASSGRGDPQEGQCQLVLAPVLARVKLTNNDAAAKNANFGLDTQS